MNNNAGRYLKKNVELMYPKEDCIITFYNFVLT